MRASAVPSLSSTRPFALFFSACFILLSLTPLTTASSSPRPPINYIEHPVVEAIDVFPRQALASSASSRLPRRDEPVLLHSDSFRLTLSAFGETYHLHLEPNDDLVHPAARINYYRTAPDGAVSLDRTEPLRREDVRAYHGDVLSASGTHRRTLEDSAGGLYQRDAEGVVGWARILVHSAGDGTPPVFEGAFSANGDVHHVVTASNYLRTKRPQDPSLPANGGVDSELVIYRASDLATLPTSDFTPATCSHDALPFNTDPTLNPVLQRPRPDLPWYDFVRRDDIGNGNDDGNNFINSIGSTAGCSQTPQIVYMGVAADCRYVRNYGSPSNATAQILTDWNSATARYKQTFNISLGIVQLEVHDTICPTTNDSTNPPWNVDCTDNVTLNDRLSMFSQWRGDKAGDNIGLWHLMSGCPTGTEVGVAWLGTLCQQTASGSSPNIVSGTAVSTAGPTEWEVVTHEIGHNFGAIHDCTSGCTLTSPCCPFSTSTCSSSSMFIMNPQSAPSETVFSPCSIGNICSMMHSPGFNTTCLLDPRTNAVQTITFQMCGNGIVEDGEDCDPGLGTTSNCCDSKTCKFTDNAVCDPASSPCCTQQCSFASAGTVCRPAMDPQCDVAETCTGTTSQCPADVTQPNGMTCGQLGGDTLTCASGMCTSVTQQCRQVGASLNLTTACSQQSQTGCQLSCQDPQDSSRCLVLQATLPNGSPCGFGGTCFDGNCNSGSVFDTAKAWYLQNLQIAIPITVVAGLIVLMLLFALGSAMRRWCCMGRPARSAPVVPLSRGNQYDSGRPESRDALLANEQPMASIGAPLMSYPEPSRSRARNTPGPSTFRDREGQQRGRQDPFAVYNSDRARRARARSGTALDTSAARRERDRGHAPRSPSAGAFPSRPGWVDDTLYNGNGRVNDWLEQTRPSSSRTRWVDETAYNGPRR